MSDDRTDEQKRTDAALEAAISECVEAYRSIPSGSVVTGWMVCGTGIGMDEDGDDTTVTFRLMPNGTMGWVPILGMLRAETLYWEHAFNSDGVA